MNTDQDALEYTLFNKKNVLNNLITALNIVIFIILAVLGDTEDGNFLLEKGAMYGPYFEAGQWWRLITAMFLHSGVIHLVNNMIALFFIGAIVERYFGHIKYITVYFISGVCGYALSDLCHPEPTVCVGASGAIFGMFASVLVILFFNGKADYISWKMLILFVALQFAEPLFEAGVYGGSMTGVFDTMFSNIDIFGHMGGFAGGIISSVLLILTLSGDKKRKVLLRAAFTAFVLILVFWILKASGIL